MLSRISDNTFGELFEMAAKRGIGLEINNRAKNEQSRRMWGVAKECGCKFTFGSDAHGAGQFLPHRERGQAMADRLDLTEADIFRV